MIRNIAVVLLFIAFSFSVKSQTSVFVSSRGNDSNNGSIHNPFKTLQAALAATSSRANNVVIEIRGGMYYIDSTLLIAAKKFHNRSLKIRRYKNEQVIISGAKPLTLQWKLYKEGIFKAPLDLTENPDRLFLNGKALSMARYPNYDAAARVFNGTAADAISNEKVKQWHNPAGGYVHALHKGEWGAFHYRITAKDAGGKLLMEGGWQNNRPSAMNEKYRFVENIFEELDAPGEWYYDITAKTLFVYPPKGIDIKKVAVSISRLNELVIIKGSAEIPVRNITLEHISFVQTNRTFMLTKEPLVRSDWTIYRGAAVLLEGTENCTVQDCIFTELGGNAVFVSNYNKKALIKDNHIFNIGGSAVSVVGNPAAVRSACFKYDAFVPWDQMDYTAGPKSNDYPQQCTVQGNLIRTIGTIEKQVAGVEIDMASHIIVSHNSIYNTPRSGINIGDGCWGGHVLEFNDVFNTVLETGDHGAFNSWGRDRFWRPQREIIDSIVAVKAGIELLDVVSPNIIRNNRFQCDHGWDIDLDDGSSNYRIYNNICLSGGVKLREGYHRTVYNNIIVNNSFHPHVWLKNSDDVFTHNIVTAPYAPILMDNWGKQIDSNFFLSQKGLNEAKSYGGDVHSIAGDAHFTAASKGDYKIKTGSAAAQIGFKNFDMNTGVQSRTLRKLAARPPVKALMAETIGGKSTTVQWLGASVKNIESLGERSAAGLPDDKGALITKIPAGSAAFKNHLQNADVIVKIEQNTVQSVFDLLQMFEKVKWMRKFEITIMRNQALQTISVTVNE